MTVLFHLTEHETVALEFTYRMCLEYSTYVDVWCACLSFFFSDLLTSLLFCSGKWKKTYNNMTYYQRIELFREKNY